MCEQRRGGDGETVGCCDGAGVGLCVAGDGARDAATGELREAEQAMRGRRRQARHAPRARREGRGALMAGHWSAVVIGGGDRSR